MVLQACAGCRIGCTRSVWHHGILLFSPWHIYMLLEISQRLLVLSHPSLWPTYTPDPTSVQLGLLQLSMQDFGVPWGYGIRRLGTLPASSLPSTIWLPQNKQMRKCEKWELSWRSTTCESAGIRAQHRTSPFLPRLCGPSLQSLVQDESLLQDRGIVLTRNRYKVGCTSTVPCKSFHSKKI